MLAGIPISAIAQPGPDPIFEKPAPLTMLELANTNFTGVRAIEVRDFAYPGYQGDCSTTTAAKRATVLWTSSNPARRAAGCVGIIFA